MCYLKMAALLMVLAACSKVGNFEQKAIEFRQECFGDHSVKCRSLLIDLNIAKLEAGIESMEKKKNDIVACHGLQYYDNGIRLINEKIAYFDDDVRPNIFMRTFMSGAEIELDLPPFKSERDFAAFTGQARQCTNNGQAANSTVEQRSAVTTVTSSPPTFKTLAGPLGIMQVADGKNVVTLNGARLFHGEDAQWQSPLQQFKLPDGRDIVLMSSAGGRGNSCETLFFFLTATESGVTHSPSFGTCSPDFKVQQELDKIIMYVPKMGGQAIFVFDGTSVKEDGQAVVLQDSNDPSK